MLRSFSESGSKLTLLYTGIELVLTEYLTSEIPGFLFLGVHIQMIEILPHISIPRYK